MRFENVTLKGVLCKPKTEDNYSAQMQMLRESNRPKFVFGGGGCYISHKNPE